MTISTYKTLIIVLLSIALAVVVFKGCNDRKASSSAITQLQQDTADNNAKNRFLLSRVASYEQLEILNDSINKAKKDEHFAKPVKERIKYIAGIPGVTIHDTFLIADHRLADTIFILQTDLSTCDSNLILKSLTVVDLKQVHTNDSLTINRVVEKAVKADKKVKRLTFLLKVFVSVCVVSTLVALVR